MEKEISKIRLRELLNTHEELSKKIAPIFPNDSVLAEQYKKFDAEFNKLIDKEAKYLTIVREGTWKPHYKN